MSDTDVLDQNQTDTDEGDELDGQDNSVIRQLRSQIKSQAKELNELRSKVQVNVFKDAGFDPDSGPGKALAKLHDGDLTVEALRETAETYGLSAGEQSDESESPALNDEQTQQIASADRERQLQSVATPVNTQTAQQRYAEAEAEGDVNAMIAAQSEMQAEWKRERGIAT